MTNRAHHSKLRRFSSPVARATANPGVVVPIYGSNATSVIVDEMIHCAGFLLNKPTLVPQGPPPDRVEYFPEPGVTVGDYLDRVGWEAISDRYGQTIAYAKTDGPPGPFTIGTVHREVERYRRRNIHRQWTDPGDDAA